MPRSDDRSRGSTYVAWGLSVLSIINMHCLYNLVAIQANDLISGIRNYYCRVVLRTTGGTGLGPGLQSPALKPDISGRVDTKRDKACPRFPPVQS
jgi:hypothetical protein